MSLLTRLRCRRMSTVSVKRTDTEITASDIHKAGLLDAFDDDGVLGTGKEKQNHLSLTYAKGVSVLAIMSNFGRKSNAKVRFGSFRLEYSRSQSGARVVHFNRSDRNLSHHFD